MEQTLPTPEKCQQLQTRTVQALERSANAVESIAITLTQIWALIKKLNAEDEAGQT